MNNVITDIVVIGSGPAGMAAATSAARHGASVTLLDEQAAAGGQIYRGLSQCNDTSAHLLGKDYLYGKSLIAALEQSGVERVYGATVWSVDKEGNVIYSKQRQAFQLQAKSVIIATGALERPYPLPGWTLPGVLTAGAAQILLKTSGIAPEKPILAGTGPLLYAVANQFITAGVSIEAIVDTVTPSQYLKAARHIPVTNMRPLITGIDYLRNIKKASVPFYRNASKLKICGSETATGIGFIHKGKSVELPSSCVLLHQGVIPNTQLSRSLGLIHSWHKLQRCFHPQLDQWGRSSAQYIRITGDGASISGALSAEQHGHVVALGALADLGIISKDKRDQLAKEPLHAYKKTAKLRRFLDTLYAPATECTSPADDTIICRCEEVTAGEVRHYAKLGCVGPNQTKAFSRCGMGPCQGRYCSLTVTELLAEEHHLHHDTVGSYRIRSPIKPVSLEELASLQE